MKNFFTVVRPTKLYLQVEVLQDIIKDGACKIIRFDVYLCKSKLQCYKLPVWAGKVEAKIRDYCFSGVATLVDAPYLKASLPLLSLSTSLACGNASERAARGWTLQRQWWTKSRKRYRDIKAAVASLPEPVAD